MQCKDYREQLEYDGFRGYFELRYLLFMHGSYTVFIMFMLLVRRGRVFRRGFGA